MVHEENIRKEFDLQRAPRLVKFAFKMECPLATDLIGQNLQSLL